MDFLIPGFLFSIVQLIGKFVFGLLQMQTGMFYTRLIMGTCTTVGLVLFHLYEHSGYLLYVGMGLIGLPAMAYNMTNVSVCNVFHPLVSSLIVCGLTSLSDVAYGVFLIYKILNESFGYSLKAKYNNNNNNNNNNNMCGHTFTLDLKFPAVPNRLSQ